MASLASALMPSGSPVVTCQLGLFFFYTFSFKFSKSKLNHITLFFELNVKVRSKLRICINRDICHKIMIARSDKLSFKYTDN